MMLVMKSLPNETPKILSLPSTKNPVSSSQFWYKNSVEDFDEEHEGNIQTDNSCLMTKPADIEQDSSRDIKYMSMDSENDYSIQDDSDFKNQIVYVLNKIFQRIQGIHHWIIKMIIVSKLTLVLNTRLLMLKLSIIIQVIWLYYSKVNLTADHEHKPQR